MKLKELEKLTNYKSTLESDLAKIDSLNKSPKKNNFHERLKISEDHIAKINARNFIKNLEKNKSDLLIKNSINQYNIKQKKHEKIIEKEKELHEERVFLRHKKKFDVYERIIIKNEKFLKNKELIEKAKKFCKNLQKNIISSKYQKIFENNNDYEFSKSEFNEDSALLKLKTPLDNSGNIEEFLEKRNHIKRLTLLDTRKKYSREVCKKMSHMGIHKTSRFSSQNLPNSDETFIKISKKSNIRSDYF